MINLDRKFTIPRYFQVRDSACTSHLLISKLWSQVRPKVWVQVRFNITQRIWSIEGWPLVFDD